MNTKVTFLLGMKLSTLIRVLRVNNFKMNLNYLGNIFSAFFFASINSFFSMFETLIYSKKIQEVSLDISPVFILGHWRSGTTHLQYLLSQDKQFYSPSTYEVLFPSIFLLTKRIGSKILSPFVPNKRPQDNMKSGLELPNEDEIALAVLSGHSPYLSWSFPKESNRFNQYLSFKNSSDKEKNEWKESLRYFSKKLLLKNPNKTLLFKSPTHTARIELIREVFPRARFIHISREPHKVFSSNIHLYNTFENVYLFLQTPKDLNKEKAILECYAQMYDSYLSDIKKHNLIVHNTKYENLVIKPIIELEKIYTHLTIQLTESTKSNLIQYISSLKGYKNNKHQENTDEQNKKITKSWSSLYEQTSH
jgi:hypothetical protein